MSEEKEKLRECAFCNQRSEKTALVMRETIDGEYFQISCGACGARGPESEEMSKAASFWNTRPGEEEVWDAARTNQLDTVSDGWYCAELDIAEKWKTCKDWQKERQR